MIHIKYNIWFTLKVDLENSEGDTLSKCLLEPTTYTRKLLHRQRILVKQQPGMLTHLIEVHADGPDKDKPLYTPLQQEAFRYELKDNGNALMSASNLASLDLQPYLLYLSNHAANKVGSQLYLHRQGAFAGVTDREFRGKFSDASPATLAVVDVFQHNLISADYRLRDGTGKCREPVFTISLAKPA